MSDRTLVCPPDAVLLPELDQQRVVIRVADPAAVGSAAQRARQNNLSVQCMLVETDSALTAVNLDKGFDDVACALFVRRMGPFRDLVRLLPRLQSLNLRVYLPAADRENYTSVRVMSSLGLATALDLRGEVAHWDDLADLMTYALLGLRVHGPISPFSELAETYSPRSYTDYGCVYFEDPTRYLHLDAQGRVALTARDLIAGAFIADRFDASTDIETLPAYIDHVGRVRSHFMKSDGCACCPGFRICLGKHLHGGGTPDGCRDFYTEMMDVVERHQKAAGRRKSVWRC